MPAIILKGDDFVGIADDRRRAIYEAEAATSTLNLDPEMKRAILDRWKERIGRVGAGFRLDGTVTRVDDQGVARIIPQAQGVGFIHGTHGGRKKPYSKPFNFNDPGEITPVETRVAAERFYWRIRDAIERFGTIPAELERDLRAEGWRVGQPVDPEKVRQFCDGITKRVREYVR
jgi:hypothetical protein